MSTVVAVAPTLADAVQSVGGTLARHAAEGHEVVLATVFAGPEHAGARDQISSVLGLAGVVEIGLPAADGRGYDARTAHDGVRTSDEHAPTAAGAALAVALSQLDPALVLSPIGLSGHVDAKLVNDALDALAVQRLRWLDLPYGLHRTPGAPMGAGELVAVPIAEQLDAKLAACALLPESDPEALRAHAVSEGARLGADAPVELLLTTGAPARPG